MIISVTGAHSDVGKTTLCSILLKELKGFGAIKFTKTSFYTSIIDDERILKQRGKDTAILLEAGAQRVIWVKSPEDSLVDALQIAIGKLSDLKGIIVEGNSPVDFLNPYLVIFIIDTKGEIKPSAIKVIKKADVIVINSKNKKEVAFPQVNPAGIILKSNLAAKQRGIISNGVKESTEVFRIDLKNKEGEINEFLSFVKKRINKAR
ncbi:MAG: hypothetical protein HY752_00805 [Nitrospirae bacterium]|nr:hypothetical protein [Nitrospirota bacterium]